MQHADLILTLAGGLIAALALGYATHRLGWSPIVGYLLAGILVGPHTPGFVANAHLAEQLAEVGVILLMFGVGLHFHLRDLLAVKGIAIAGALVQSGVTTALGGWAFHALGWSWSQGIVFGLALSVASTVVLIRVLSDNGALQSATGRIAIGWLVVEDVFTVFVLVLLPVWFSPAEGSRSVPIATALAALKIAVFAGFTLLAGSRLIPWLLNKIADTRSRELFTLSVLAIALGIAVASTYFFGVSMALGAFLAGMVVGQSEFSARAAAEALPMRDAFAVMFFLSIGLLFDPAAALSHPSLLLITLAIVLIAKPLAAIGIIGLLGYGPKVAAGVALALTQIGEFSFLLATLGRQVGALPEDAFHPLVATAIVSILINPLLYRTAGPLSARLRPFIHDRVGRDRQPATTQDNPGPRAVVAGYGPTGQMVFRILQGYDIEPTVIEMNIETYRRLRDEGIPAVYGDANQREVLEQAGIADAASFILSASGSAGSTEAVRIARELNPEILILARTDYVRESESLDLAGADEVFSGEGEVALAISDSILRRFGATPDQIDEARQKVREKLFAS